MLEEVTLGDGTRAWVTDLRAEDRERLAQEYAALSMETKQQRFLAPVDRLTAPMLRHLVDEVDGVHHVALALAVLTSPHTTEPVALARMVRYADAPEAADMAVTVKDDWQGRGVATALLRVLVAHRPAGVVRVATEVQAGNDASLAMLRRLGPTAVRPTGYGALDVEVRLPGDPDAR